MPSLATLSVALLAALLVAPGTAGVDPFAAESEACPDGATWRGQPPPAGDGHRCVLEREGQEVLHGWSVRFDPETGIKREECEYRQGQLDGRCSRYAEDGRPLTRGFYRQGVAVGFHFVWEPLADAPPEPRARRRVLLGLFEALSVPQPDVPVLAQHVLDHYDVLFDDIRNAPQVCAPSLCVSTGTVGGRALLALEIMPAAERIEGQRTVYRVAAERAAAYDAAERRAAQKRRKAYEKAMTRYRARLRSWGGAHLLCNDGTYSPSCTCGRASYQGCCSHHDGVDGCPREMPEEPEMPEEE
jgi:hypothetical protein